MSMSRQSSKLSFDPLADPKLRMQKQKQIDGLNSLEHQFNNASVAMINNLQDSEANEILSNVNDYITLCLQRISKYDCLIDVSWSEINSNPYTSSFNKKNKSKNPSSQNTTLNSNTDNSFSHYSEQIFSTTSVATTQQSDSILTINSMYPMDFLQNGIRCGPLETQRIGGSTVADDLIQLSKMNASPLTTLLNANNAASITGSKAPKTELKTFFRLKFLMELDINKNYFEITEHADKELIHSIRFAKKPKKWSIQDFDQISLPLSAKINEESFSRVLSTIIKEDKSQFLRTNYLTVLKPDTYRYLNSKALFDRLLKHFAYVLKNEWPTYHQGQQLTKENVTTNNANKENQAKLQPILEEFKFCESNGNQLKIGFKWKGVKFKDLDVVILIKIGVKFSSKKKIIEEKINQSVIDICNEFFSNGGFFKKINKITTERMEYISNWMNKYFKINLKQVYLIPTGVHHWTVSFDMLKLNLVKFLIWSNSLNNSFIGVEPIVADVFNNTNVKKNNQLSVPTKFEIKQPIYNFYSTVSQGKSHFLLFCKVLQIFASTFLNVIEDKLKVEDENMNIYDLIIEMMLIEIKLNRFSSNPTEYAVSKLDWTQDSIFDHLWSSLLRLRQSILYSKMPDSFEIFENGLPKLFLKYIGFYELSLPLYTNLTDRNRMELLQNKTSEHPLTSAVETAMRLVFTCIITDEVYIFVVADNDIPESKDKTIFNQKSNLINEILDYKIKHGVNGSTDKCASIAKTANTKASLNSVT